MAFTDRRDADDAIYHLDRTMFAGREITVCYSKEGRKTPREMLDRDSRMGVGALAGRGGVPAGMLGQTSLQMRDAPAGFSPAGGRGMQCVRCLGPLSACAQPYCCARC